MSDEKPDPIIINIWGEKVALGPLSRDLLPLYTRWVNSFEVILNLGLAPAPVIAENEGEWYERNRANRDSLIFTIYTREDLRPIGTSSLMNINYRHQRAEFGIMIGEKECWNKGYGSETARLLLDYGFKTLGLNSISLTVFSSNKGAIRAYEKAGYKVAGHLRQAIRLKGEYFDVIYMDCLASEFQKS